MTWPSLRSGNRVVVSDSSPLIHLARIGRLGLLEKIFGEVVIPPAVYREVIEEGKGKPGWEELSTAKWLRVMEIKKNQALKQSLLVYIDEGEAEAIALANEIHADLLLLDEREARILAKKLGLRVTGTIGILLKAKKKHLIKNLKHELEKLKTTGFRISPNLEQEALKKAGETQNKTKNEQNRTKNSTKSTHRTTP